MVDDFVGDVTVGEVGTEKVIELRRHLPVGDEEDAADERGETVDGSDTKIDLAYRGVACGACDVIVPVFAVQKIAVAFGAPDGVTAINPEHDSVDDADLDLLTC